MEIHFIRILLSQCIVVQLYVSATGQAFYNPHTQLSQLKIGGLFEAHDLETEIIFKHAVERVNKDASILPNHHLSVVTETLNSQNSYNARTNICNLFKEQVVGIFGPRLHETASHAQAVCDRFDIPHVETRWDYINRQDKYIINLFPHPDVLGEAFANFLDHIKWEHFLIVIIFDSRDNLLNLQGLIKDSTLKKRHILLRQLSDDGNYGPLLKSLQRNYDAKKIIIDCELHKALRVLKQAQEIGMIRFDYEYFLTTLDLQPWDLNEFGKGDATIWAFRMIDSDKVEAEGIISELSSLPRSQLPGANYPNFVPVDKPRSISTREALVFDAVTLFSKALHENVNGLRTIPTVACDKDESWTVGSSVINSMRSMKPFQGLTGIVQFNNSGYRTDIILELVKLTDTSLAKIGVWEYARHSHDRFSLLDPETYTVTRETDVMPLFNRTLTVVTIMTMPFCTHALSEEVLEGNDRYVGFSIDLLTELRKRLHFDYHIKLVDDGTHDGMITEVLDGKADFVIGDLTVTKERQGKLDFTMPFMNLGISILFTKPQAKAPNLFTFMTPFAWKVWICMVISFFGVSFVLFAVGRLTPYEWENSFPCIKNPEVLQNQFSLKNSFWFTIGSIMQQGSDLAPKSASTRMIAGTWWFFTLIMVSSYTANLATFLIVQEMEYTFSTLAELSTQSKIDYGCMVNGSTMKFFQFSDNKVKQKIWENMRHKPEVSFKSSNDEGIAAVRANPGRYAFFMESTIIEYYMERKCGLANVGGLLDHKGYGIALRKDSPYLDLFNEQILKMQETGELDRLKRIWWKEKGKETSETCPAASVSDTVKPLQLTNVGGVFVVLVSGCVGAVLIGLIEFGIRSRRMKLKGESLFHEILKDLHFALQCRGNVKPVKKNSVSSSIMERADDELGRLT